MPVIEIWMEGYAATGESNTASLLGCYEAASFDEAVRAMLADQEKEKWRDIRAYYSCSERSVSCAKSAAHPLGRRFAPVHALWGCRLFDNEADARKSFG
jgi:hypothetical protein